MNGSKIVARVIDVRVLVHDLLILEGYRLVEDTWQTHGTTYLRP